MRMLVPYDKKKVPIEIDDQNFVGSLVSRVESYNPGKSPQELVEASLDRPIGSPKLEEQKNFEKDTKPLAALTTRFGLVITDPDPLGIRAMAKLYATLFRREFPGASILNVFRIPSLTSQLPAKTPGSPHLYFSTPCDARQRAPVLQFGQSLVKVDPKKLHDAPSPFSSLTHGAPRQPCRVHRGSVR